MVTPVIKILQNHPRVYIGLLLLDRTVNLIEKEINVAIRISMLLSYQIEPLVKADKLEVLLAECETPATLVNMVTPMQN